MISFIFFLYSIFAYSQYSGNIDIWLERNESKVPSKASYIKTNTLKLSSKNKNYRIAVKLINSTHADMEAVVIRYSIRLAIQKTTQTFETVGLISSSLRTSDIKKNSSKVFYIYDIKKIFDEVVRYKKLSYKPVEVKVETMKEPKRNEEVLFRTVSFPIDD